MITENKKVLKYWKVNKYRYKSDNFCVTVNYFSNYKQLFLKLLTTRACIHRDFGVDVTVLVLLC